MPVDEVTMVWRIALAAGLGFLVGLDREMHGRSAGLRTFMLVAMAGALLMSLSLHLTQMFADEAADSIIRLDPGRLPSYAIAGMGFLGAGVIIQGQLRSMGVTTGAAMWACTGIGLAVGAGLYLPASAATVITLVALRVFSYFTPYLPKTQYVSLVVDIATPDSEQAVRDLLKRNRAKIDFAGRERCVDGDTVRITFSLTIYSSQRWRPMLADLDKIPGVTCYTWRESEVA